MVLECHPDLQQSTSIRRLLLVRSAQHRLRLTCQCKLPSTALVQKCFKVTPMAWCPSTKSFVTRIVQTEWVPGGLTSSSLTPELTVLAPACESASFPLRPFPALPLLLPLCLPFWLAPLSPFWLAPLLLCCKSVAACSACRAMPQAAACLIHLSDTPANLTSAE